VVCEGYGIQIVADVMAATATAARVVQACDLLLYDMAMQI
jgi:hypothetical protein